MMINLLTADARTRQVIFRDPEYLAQKYQLSQLVGLGGSSVVYVARSIPSTDPNQMPVPETISKIPRDRIVAIKLYKNMRSYYAERLYMRTFKSLGIVKVEVIHACESNTQPYIVMPVYRPVIKPPFPNKVIQPYRLIIEDFYKLFGDLSKIHGAGYIHGDIRASNVMADDEGDVFFIDFGFCRKADVEAPYQGTLETASNRILRSLGEAYTKGKTGARIAVSCRDDMESLFKFMYSYLTGRVPPKTIHQLYDFWQVPRLVVHPAEGKSEYENYVAAFECFFAELMAETGNPPAWKTMALAKKGEKGTANPFLENASESDSIFD